MKILAKTIALLLSVALFGCATRGAERDRGWITLLDGPNLEHWERLGDANWRFEGGALQADRGSGFLVSKNAYADFHLRAEFWVDSAANSGIFIRCSDPKRITTANAYEINIYDNRPDPSYGTGAIVDVAKVSTRFQAGARWNTFDITAQGPQLTVALNGSQTVKVRDSKHLRGPIALQYDRGVVKFRKVQIRPL